MLAANNAAMLRSVPVFGGSYRSDDLCATAACEPRAYRALGTESRGRADGVNEKTEPSLVVVPRRTRLSWALRNGKSQSGRVGPALTVSDAGPTLRNDAGTVARVGLPSGEVVVVEARRPARVDRGVDDCRGDGPREGPLRIGCGDNDRGLDHRDQQIIESCLRHVVSCGVHELVPACELAEVSMPTAFGIDRDVSGDQDPTLLEDAARSLVAAGVERRAPPSGRRWYTVPRSRGGARRGRRRHRVVGLGAADLAST